MGIGVLGVGKYVPESVLFNSPEFADKTGIRERRIVSQGELSSDLAAKACLRSLESAGVSAEQIGLIICATYTGDYQSPATSCKIQSLIGAENAGAFDILANCTGFQIGLSAASDRLTLDASLDYALVVGVTTQSRYIQNIQEEGFYGDGAGAVVLGRVPDGYGVLATEVFSNTDVYESVRLLRPDPAPRFLEMNGLDVWKQVIQNQPKCVSRVLDKIGATTRDVDFFVFHQANVKLVEYLVGKMKMSLSKTHITADRYGNTAEASLPITLCEAVESGKINRNDLVVISGVGAGFIFGATVLRWY